MDFAAATPMHVDVKKEVIKGLSIYGNPSSPHEEGRRARSLIELARERIARVLLVKADSLFFTSSGTEGNNLAISGVVSALIEKGAKPNDLHIITSGFEHPSLNGPVSSLIKKGVQVSFACPDIDGIITADEIKKHIKKETILVSIVAVQSEIGMIQPLKEIRRALDLFREKREQVGQVYFPETDFPIFHTDASASSMFLDLSPERLGVDLATYDGQKIMGPKGVGVLYKDSSVTLSSLIKGGKQERGIRPGTENTPGILGLAKAFEISKKGREDRVKKVEAVRDYLKNLLEKEITHIEVNGGMKNRIANNLNVSIPNGDGDYLSVLMDKSGVAVSPRSSCIASGSASTAVESLGKDKNLTKGTIRFSLSPSVTKKDAKVAVFALKEALGVIDLA